MSINRFSRARIQIGVNLYVLALGEGALYICIYFIFLKEFLSIINKSQLNGSKQAICMFNNSLKQFSLSRSRRNYKEFSTKHLWESGKGVFQLEIRSSEKFHVTFITGNWIAAKSKENIETLLGIRWVFSKWKKYGKNFSIYIPWDCFPALLLLRMFSFGFSRCYFYPKTLIFVLSFSNT